MDEGQSYAAFVNTSLNCGSPGIPGGIHVSLPAVIKKTLQFILQALRGDEQDYTHLPIRRAILLLSIPMVLEMVMESLFAVVDVFFVAKLGIHAVATVGLTESVMMLVYSMAIGLSAAATAMVARRIGEGNREAAATAAAQAIWLGLGISLVLGIVGYWFTPDILALLGGDEQLIREGQGYTKIMFAGNITIMFLFLLNAIFRGAGDAALAMRSLWLANGINIILDPCLIMGLGPFPEMGIEGAAVATLIGRGTGVLYQFYHLFGVKHIIRMGRRHLILVKDVTLRLLTVGWNGAAQYLIASASWIFLVRIIADFGPAALAGYTISIRVIIFTILPAWGMANAASTLVGQHLGAKQPEKSEAAAWIASRYTMIFMLIVAVIYISLASPIIAFFDPTPEVVRVGAQSLQIISLGYIFYAYGMVLSQAFNGAGDTRTPMILNLVSFWLVEIPLAWVLAMKLEWGPSGVFFAVAVAESLLAVLSILLFRKGRWKATII